MLKVRLMLLLVTVVLCGTFAMANAITPGFTPGLAIPFPGGGGGYDPSFYFTFSIGGNAGSAILGTTDLGGGHFLVTSGTLDVTAGAATGTYPLIPGGPGTFGVPGFTVDNVLSPAVDPIFDIYGLAFGNGSLTINIWGNSPGNYSFYSYDGSGYNVSFDGPGTATATAIPEPATLLLLGSGLLGIARIARKNIMGRL